MAKERMKILLLADYPVGAAVAQYLVEQGEEVVGVGVHPSKLQRSRKEILDILSPSPDRIFEGDVLQTPENLNKISAIAPDLILCVFWGYLLKPELIKIPSRGCINFHCAFLPYNRGKNPNVWPIIEGTPAGVTLHYIDEGIDSGDIISQRQVEVRSIDTAETLYRRFETSFVELFKETWPKIRAGTAPRRAQDNSHATHHYAKDFKKLDCIDLKRTYTGKELLDLLRARTFPPHPSAYFIDDEGKKVYVRVQLEFAE